MRHKQGSLGSFDLFMSDIKVNVSGRSSVKTKVGTGLSVLFLGVLAGLTYMSFSDFLDTSKSIISQAVVTTDLEPPISFTEDKLFPMIRFDYQISTALTPADIARFVTIELLKVSQYKDTATGETKTSFHSYKIVPCAELAARNDFRSLADDDVDQRQGLIEYGICVDPDEDITMGRKSKQEAFSQVMAWRLLPCSLPSGCASKEEMAKVTFLPMMAKPILDLGDRNKPVKYFVQADQVSYLSTGITSRQVVKVIKTEIINNDGFLFGSRLVNHFTSIISTVSSASDRNPTQLSCTPDQLKAKSCIPYFIQNIMVGKQKMIITRQYKGIVETFSELGGMIDMLFLLFYLPYSLYNARVLREVIVKEVHGIERPAKLSISRSSSTALVSASAISLSEERIQHDASMKSYKRLIEAAESHLDLIKIGRELYTIKALLGQLLPEQLEAVRKSNEVKGVGTPAEPEACSVSDQLKQPDSKKSPIFKQRLGSSKSLKKAALAKKIMDSTVSNQMLDENAFVPVASGDFGITNNRPTNLPISERPADQTSWPVAPTVAVDSSMQPSAGSIHFANL